jgi:DNA polymerase
MRLCFIDYETYWSVTHSLTKINPIAYVMHPDTEVISIAYKFGTEKTVVLFGEAAIKDWCDSVDWSDVLVVGHNLSGFDAMIHAWRFGVNPKMWGCTLAMARPIYQSTVGGSLKKVASALGIGEKGDLEATNTKGKRLADFSAEELAAMYEYNALDTELCAGIFNALAPLTSKMEMRLIDATVRMLTEPVFDMDVALLEEALVGERRKKHEMLLDLASLTGTYSTEIDNDDGAAAAAEAVKKILASAVKLSALLRDLGVEPPVKPSPSDPQKTIPALAKTDEAFIALQDHDDPLVATAARARLGVKSTILESRIERFLEVSGAVAGKMPVMLQYYAATTGRWGGGGAGTNLQNLPRVSGKLTDVLRNSLKAPAGYKVVVVDLSGIELRVNHFLWKAKSSVALYEADPANADLYKDFASKLYSVDVASVTKAQRQVGKVAHLGLGFGAGSKTFRRVAKTMGGVIITEDESADVVQKWRTAYPEIKAGWASCQRALVHIYNKHNGYEIDPWGMCTIVEGGIKTPVGMIRYPHLEYVEADREMFYGEGRNRSRVYGPLVDENIVQHLARCIMGEQLITINKRYQVAHTVHDELVCVVPEAVAEECLQHMLSVMRTSPAWWPEIKLWAEGDIGDTYGDAK